MEVAIVPVSTPPKSFTDIIRLLIIDEQPLTLRGLGAMFAVEPGISVCGMASTAAQATDIFSRESPDIVITDIPLPDMNGLDLIVQLTTKRPDLGVIVVTDRSDPLCAERALRAGARGYVLKSDPCETMLLAVQAVREGSYYLNKDICNQFIRAMIHRTQMLIPSPSDVLSERELEIFNLLGDGQTSRQIAVAMRLSVKTVETYRNRIKAKLHAHNTNDVVQQAVRWVEARCACYDWKGCACKE